MGNVITAAIVLFLAYIYFTTPDTYVEQHEIAPSSLTDEERRQLLWQEIGG